MVRRICPRCGSRNTAVFLWGMPAWSPQMQEQLDKGELLLGGCCISVDNPSHHCNKCKKDFGRDTALQEISTTEIYFRLGGYFGGYHDLTISKTNTGALVHYQPPYCADDFTAIDKEITSSEWLNLVHKLYHCYIIDWKRRYVDSRILDGTQWDLEVKLCNAPDIKRTGSNAYPPHWSKFLTVINSLNISRIV